MTVQIPLVTLLQGSPYMNSRLERLDILCRCGFRNEGKTRIEPKVPRLMGRRARHKANTHGRWHPPEATLQRCQGAREALILKPPATTTWKIETLKGHYARFYAVFRLIFQLYSHFEDQMTHWWLNENSLSAPSLWPSRTQSYCSSKMPCHRTKS